MAVQSLQGRQEPTGGDPLAEAVAASTSALTAAEIEYALVGGLASALRGRARWSSDIDLLVRPRDAHRALDVLSRAGFETEETDPAWIFKAFRGEMTVDLLFVVKGLIQLDDEMLEKATAERLHGHEVRVASAEDLVVMKAIAHDEPSGHHWHDALGILARTEIDWPYLIERARAGPRRVLALLVYAQADDLLITSDPIERLYASVYPESR